MVALLSTLVSPVRAAAATTDPDLAAIDRYVEAQLAVLGVPGAALAVVQGDRVVHLRSFGRADAAGRPMTAQTPLLIGSLTKSFTAVAIIQFVEQGQIALDDPVQRYIPWFRVADPAASAQITVRHLLTHTSGIAGRGEAAWLLHDGNTGNYRADMWLLPEHERGFVLLMNASNELQTTPTRAVGQGIAELLLGREPAAPTLNPVAQVFYVAVLALAGLQVLGTARAIGAVRRWRRAAPRLNVWRHVGLPLMSGLLVAFGFLVVVPGLFLGGSLPVALLLVPDLGVVSAVAGGIALAWTLLRTLIALNVLRRSGVAPGSLAAPTPGV